MTYIKQLDSIRAIAVIMVIICHWTFQAIPYNSRNAIGEFGVDIFFVLSGFLITSILIKNKKFDNRLASLKTFYIRRSLRIFPIYYLLIFFIFCASRINGYAYNYLSLLTYTANFNFYFGGGSMYIGHLWSLSVEEQFYLIWPFIALFSSPHRLVYLIILFIITGVTCQYIMGSDFASIMLPFNCFHAFGIGGVLSWIVEYKRDKLTSFYKALKIVSLLSLSVIVCGLILNYSNYRYLRLLDSIVACFIITHVLIGKEAALLNNKCLIWIGKRSYGIYLYHFFIPPILVYLNNKISPTSPLSFYQKYNHFLFVFECAFLLIVISSVSYEYVEKPFLKKKNRYSG